MRSVIFISYLFLLAIIACRTRTSNAPNISPREEKGGKTDPLGSNFSALKDAVVDYKKTPDYLSPPNEETREFNQLVHSIEKLEEPGLIEEYSKENAFSHIKERSESPGLNEPVEQVSDADLASNIRENLEQPFEEKKEYWALMGLAGLGAIGSGYMIHKNWGKTWTPGMKAGALVGAGIPVSMLVMTGFLLMEEKPDKNLEDTVKYAAIAGGSLGVFLSAHQIYKSYTDFKKANLVTLAELQKNLDLNLQKLQTESSRIIGGSDDLKTRTQKIELALEDLQTKTVFRDRIESLVTKVSEVSGLRSQLSSVAQSTYTIANISGVELQFNESRILSNFGDKVGAALHDADANVQKALRNYADTPSQSNLVKLETAMRESGSFIQEYELKLKSQLGEMWQVSEEFYKFNTVKTSSSTVLEMSQKLGISEVEAQKYLAFWDSREALQKVKDMSTFKQGLVTAGVLGSVEDFDVFQGKINGSRKPVLDTDNLISVRSQARLDVDRLNEDILRQRRNLDLETKRIQEIDRLKSEKTDLSSKKLAASADGSSFISKLNAMKGPLAILAVAVATVGIGVGTQMQLQEDGNEAKKRILKEAYRFLESAAAASR